MADSPLEAREPGECELPGAVQIADMGAPPTDPEPVATADASLSAHSARYKQTYHSRFGAVTQARWVYLEGSGVGARLRDAQPTCVLEIGFGLGLNTLLTADCAAMAGTPLRYHSIDKEPICPGFLAQLNYHQWLSSSDVQKSVQQCLLQLAAARASPAGTEPLPRAASAATREAASPSASRAALAEPAEARAVYAPLPHHGELHLLQADATHVDLAAGYFDAVYLDAFSPAVNPECWSTAFLSRLHETLKPGGVLSTYSVQGKFRRALSACGFKIGKCAGPPGKREMLRAVRLPL